MYKHARYDIVETGQLNCAQATHWKAKIRIHEDVLPTSPDVGSDALAGIKLSKFLGAMLFPFMYVSKESSI